MHFATVGTSRSRRVATFGIVAALVLSATAGTAAADAPPRPLVTIEEQAEDIIDRVPGQRWSRVSADVATIRSAWSRYRPRAATNAIDPSLLEDLDVALRKLTAAAEGRRSAATLQSANDLSRATVELLGSYDLGHPVQVGRLDVIGRQILLDLEAHDRAGVAEDIGVARVEWNAIRAEVASHSGAVGAQEDATLTALDEANRAENDGLLKAEVRAMLEIVDAMEALYR